MSKIKNDASLRGKIRNIAKKNNLRAQEVLQMYLFEHLLMRLAASEYANKFVLKGGLLISSMIGISQRTTMDMDTTVVGLSMDECSITQAVISICDTPVDDQMTYSFEQIEPIRKDVEYANWRAHIRVQYGRINAPIKVDITTGDSIVPQQVSYPYPTLFGGGAITVMSYPVATILAEKFETVVSRGEANTRGRDYYDIHSFMQLKAEELKVGQIKQALEATAAKRGTLDTMRNYGLVLSEVKASPVMQNVWQSYLDAAPYAKGLEFAEVVDSAISLGDLIYSSWIDG